MSAAEDNPSRELHTIRDTVEGVWVAIVLAFVLRAFLIEAFVIPTGSMAPRLLGEHWPLQCSACGYEYDYGLGQDGGGTVDRRTRSIPAGARCPNCTYPYDLGREAQYLHSGDRVLVLKYVYRFRDPRPWDVIVFKNPQNNRENYIKRLVGLPGETAEIVHGNVFVKGPDDETFRIRRKPREAQEATWQVIYDNNYRPDPGAIREAERRGRDVSPPQWITLTGQDRWDLDGLNGRKFTFAGGERAGLNGRKFTFAGGERAELELDAPRSHFLPWYGYNSPQAMQPPAVDRDRDICTDLKLSFMFVPTEPDAGVSLETSSFGHRFRGKISADGSAALMYKAPGEDWVRWKATSIDPMPVGEAFDVALEHVDFSLRLRIDGRTVLEVSDGGYPFDYRWLKDRMARAETDPIPAPDVRITASGGSSEIWHVGLMRDVYYTSPPQRRIPRGVAGDYARDLLGLLERYEDLSKQRWWMPMVASIGEGKPGWGTAGNPIKLRTHENRDLDEFFVVGDNSPQSLDSRSWTHAAPTLRLYDEQGEPQYRVGTVPRYCIIGRALLVYWPAGHRVPGLPGLPLVPNVGRMRLIR